MIMSTPRLKLDALPTTGDPFDTALIARLANELFAEGSSTAPTTASAPGVPSPMPSIPTTAAGIPWTQPETLPNVADIPFGTGTDNGLSHGYPLATTSTHPPVHPVLQREKALNAPSGAHDPRSNKSHPFGEPYLDGTIYGTAAATKPASPPPSVPAIEILEIPEFYFLDTDINASPPGLAEATDNASTRGLSVFDVETIRRDFPVLDQRVNGHPLIWLDNAATTQKPQSVIDATSRFYSRDNSNIHRAAHTLARRATDLFEAGREKVRQFLGAADTKEIVFLRGTTAPINDNGEVPLDEFTKLLGARTKFVSVAHVSNSLGTIVPVEQIVALSHARGVPVLIDGAQSTPHIPVNVTAIDADFYVFSGHKVFGPTGIGALYGKLDLLEEMPPYQGGGHMIRDVRFEKTTYQNAPVKFEAGTPDIAGVVGLAAAIDYLTDVGVPAIASYEHALLEYAAQALATVPGLRPIGTAANKASVLSFVIPGIPNENIARHLDNHGIAVRAGHHCAMPAQRHFGLEGTVRPSLAFYNTYEEVDTLVQVLYGLPKP